jgi:chromosome segregation and condensation protein ScpB
MARRAKAKIEFDREQHDLPEPLRRRQFMQNIEAVIFASKGPVPRERLALVVADDYNIDELLALIAEEWKSRPFEIVKVAGGYQARTRPGFAPVIQASGAAVDVPMTMTKLEGMVLIAIAYGQPITRQRLSEALGKPISSDVIAGVRRTGFVTTGPRSPEPGAPFTYVTTMKFLEHYSLESLDDLPPLDGLDGDSLRAPMPEELRLVTGLADDVDDGDSDGREEEEDENQVMGG